LKHPDLSVHPPFVEFEVKLLDREHVGQQLVHVSTGEQFWYMPCHAAETPERLV